MDTLLTHASLFPKQLQQFLETLGHKILALLIAVVMPLVLWLGLAGQPGRHRANPSPGIQEPLSNLVYVNLPPETYREVPQPEATRRRGLWESRMAGEQIAQLVVINSQTDSQAEHQANWQIGVLPPNFDLSNLQTDLSHPYQAILPVLKATRL